MMKYSDWQLKRSYEQYFKRSIENLFHFDPHSKVENPADPYEIVNFLRNLSNNPAFQNYCNSIAYKMVTMVEKQNQRDWREAASKGSKGQEIYGALKREISSGLIQSALSQSVMENARLISKIPYDLSLYMSGYIQEETYKGRRASDIAKDLINILPEDAKNRAKLIARTEVGKTQCALTQARAQNLGLDWYIWRTSKDSRVRHAHDKMDGVLVKWSDPPNPEKMFGGHDSGNGYHAGMIYNCRCYSEPVIDISHVDFPHRVHISGNVRSMTKKEFEK